MKRNVPMKRGTGLQRSGIKALRAGLPVARDGTAADPEQFGVVTVDTIKPLRRGTYAGATTGVAMPKEPRLENPHLLLMARNQPRPCLIIVPGLCVTLGRETSCCACHGNSHVWNKGGHQKAHDFFSVWGCARCHSWLDSSYSASGEERDQAFRRALALQIIHWDVIATNLTGNPKDVAAARWALEHLIDRGYADLSVRAGQFATPNLKAIHAR